MQIISDFQQARAALQRTAFDLREVPPEMESRLKEVFDEQLSLEKAVEQIVYTVRTRRDAALFNYAKEIDGVTLGSLEVDEDEILAARDRVPDELISALEEAADRVQSFHQAQLQHSLQPFTEGGLGQLVHPLQRVGIYIPGGTASYPSTVLMTAIPARVAGVEEIIVTSPPTSDGEVSPATLAACVIAGADRVFRVGGAQAIAAMAYGTESIPKVDKICGPGNIFVTWAKRIVFGTVDIDGITGPTETVLLADDSASAACCAADLLAQAEHDALSAAILITTSSRLADEVNTELEQQLEGLERAEIARRSLEMWSRIIVVSDMEQAVELVNLYAPEHLSLMVRDAAAYVKQIRNAGGIFVGESTPEVLGDYIAGPSHVMPTGGSARFASPLGVNDFLKLTTVVSLSDAEARKLGPSAAAIARAEGLTAHARAAEMRARKGGKR